VQLTMGGPPPIYNGGLLHVPVRHFDARAKRPGLPPDVAALVRRVDEDGVCIDLVNVGTDIVREVAIQAGAYAEHRWTTVHTVDEDGTAIHGPVAVDGPHIRVTIDPGAVTTLILGHERYVSPPSTQLPWR
jgi:hypothetical protein